MDGWMDNMQKKAEAQPAGSRGLAELGNISQLLLTQFGLNLK